MRRGSDSSLWKKYVSDTSHKIEDKDLEIQEVKSYVKKLLKIRDTKVKVVRAKTIPMVKALKRTHALEEATWEVELDMKTNYQLSRTHSLRKFHEKISSSG